MSEGLLMKNRTIKKCVESLQQYVPLDRILAQRIIKATASSTLAFIFVLIPQIRNRLGLAPPMLPLISVMVHPGRRVSATIQGAIYCITGLIFGLSYALFGRFLAQRCIGSDWDKLTDAQHYTQHYRRYEAALAVLAVFETLMLLFHGWMRSVNHTYFGIVFPLFLVVHFTFLEEIKVTAGEIAHSYTTPFYLGIAISLFWNLTLFPEFGSTYLGNATVDTLNQVHKSVDHAINFFLTTSTTLNNNLYNKEPVSLSKLLKIKDAIDKKVSGCEMAYQECVYEISYSYVSPNDLSSTIKQLNPLTKYIKGIINACQLEYILLNNKDKMTDYDPHVSVSKEIEFGDAKKLLVILKKLSPLVYELHKQFSESLYAVKLALAYAYDVDLARIHTCSMFKNGQFPVYNKKSELPADLNFENRIKLLEDAIINFDLGCRDQLIQVDETLLDPSDEMFLLSSFLMNFKEVGQSVIIMMNTVNKIYHIRKTQEQKGWLRGKTLWLTFFRNLASFKMWLLGNYTKSSFATENDNLKGLNNTDNAPLYVSVKRPQNQEDNLLAQRLDEIKTDDTSRKLKLPISNDDINNSCSSHNNSLLRTIWKSPKKVVLSFMVWCYQFHQKSKAHEEFALQVAIALLIVSFPMFLPSARDWYNQYHGAWIGFVCILCMEPSVGGTFWVFFLRAVGVITGSAWAYLAYVSGVNQTNPYLMTVITAIGSIPGFYVLLGTPYVKAAIIQIISIYIVILAAKYPGNTPGGILVNFAKRCLAVGYGGGVSLLVQISVFPTRARDQLGEEIAFVCGCISKMESIYATGLEGESLQISLTEDRYLLFSEVSNSAKAALARANAYKGLTRQEPRLKGSFSVIENVFTQIIFIQKQIIDRMDNVALLRRKYGSAAIEELNDIVYPYRRQVVANIICLMRALQEAFLNKTPLPQYLPSARISHRRLVNKVKQTLNNRYTSTFNNLRPRVIHNKFKSDDDDNSSMNSANKITLPPHEYVLKEKFLSWSASSAAIEEIIEYVEELTKLTKVLVGVNEFKYGFLSRPLYTDWAAEAVTGFQNFINESKSKDIKDKTFSVETSPSLNLKQIRTEEASIYNDIEDIEEELSMDSAEEPESYKIANDAPFEEQPNFSVIPSHSHKAQNANMNPILRKRAFSISAGTGMRSDSLNLGDQNDFSHMDSSIYDDIDTSDDELPLALKKILSNKSSKQN